MARLRKELTIIRGFYQQVPAYRQAADLGLDIKVVMRIYHRLRPAIFHLAELEGAGSFLYA